MVPVKLVFVDDDIDDRELIKDGLTALVIDHFLVLESGRSLFAYLDGLKAVQLPEAIILDLNMPEMGGFDILKKLKTISDYQDIPVYILTTSTSTDLKQHCKEEGAAGYFTKPNTLVELYSILSEINTSVME
jgi:two-component system chemotaxis response regulator CheY